MRAGSVKLPDVLGWVAIVRLEKLAGNLAEARRLLTEVRAAPHVVGCTLARSFAEARRLLTEGRADPVKVWAESLDEVAGYLMCSKSEDA